MSNISLTLDESTATAMHSFMEPIARLQSCHVTVLAFRSHITKIAIQILLSNFTWRARGSQALITMPYNPYCSEHDINDIPGERFYKTGV